ncbi:hypothetical protein BDV38DRAFT_164858 [Aspergillus pseudotamarii]|uniref:Uncharacterized protein n=1 Tax=Aspergillus pseudotamarii TaxID=132259 RepID=A0A5N6SKA2_ASPPS|nr:uncharacterized protein BDV38DRAFT_164858 [Aspergillus pseudotamarii]KAE8134190.1 hypothetical protein BDV38DRAFT_164858 [Aspergillus pseudotamarii]
MLKRCSSGTIFGMLTQHFTRSSAACFKKAYLSLGPVGSTSIDTPDLWLHTQARQYKAASPKTDQPYEM